MKILKRFSILLLVLSNMALSAGCWNYNDIEKYLMVAGVAIDKDKKENKYIVNTEVLDFEMSGKEAKISSRIIESKGDTIFDAIRNAINVTGKKLYWGHGKIIIISKDVAEEGIAPILDLSYRDEEIREEMHVLISKANSARDLLKQETMTTDLRAYEIDKMIMEQKVLAKTPRLRVYQMVNILEEKGICAAVPAASVVTNAGKRTVQLMGTAMFKGDKLIGFLNDNESQNFLFATNRVTRGLLIEKISDNKELHNITLEIFRSKTKIKPKYSQGRLVMNVDIYPVVAIAEVETQENYTGKKGREKLKKIAEDSLKTSVINVIKKVQSEYDADIFGFGKAVKAEMPSTWKSIEPKWDDIFRTLEVNVNVNIDIKNSAIDSKTIRVEK